MELANQIVYLAALVMLFGMTFSAYKGLASSVKGEDSVYFWFFALVIQMISYASFYAFPYLGVWTLVVGNTAQLAVDILLGMLFRSMRITVPRIYVFTIGWILIVYGAVLADLDFSQRMLAVCLLTIGLSFWQIYEIYKLEKRQHSIFLLFLMFAISAQIVLCALRLEVMHLEADSPLHSLIHKTMYEDDSIELQIRMLLVFLYVLIFMGIANYFYDKARLISDDLLHVREDQMLNTLQSLASSRDNETGQHLVRTQAYVKLLCDSLRSTGYYLEILTDEYVDQLVRVTPLHDIGKVGIPDEILLKEGPHDEKERAIMRTHAALGERILRRSGVEAGDLLIRTAAEVAGGHHEHWDGTGYPRGLVAEAIPLAARIMAIADVYDALTTQRVYKAAWTHDAAVNEVVRQKGKIFDPAVVEAFMKVKEQFRQVSIEFKG